MYPAGKGLLGYCHGIYGRQGYGIYIMQEIEGMFPTVKEFYLDTPIWNIRTNSFYQKLGYTEYKRDGEFVYYTKVRS